MKDIFEKAEIEVIIFDDVDIITESSVEDDPFQPPLQPGFEEETDIDTE